MWNIIRPHLPRKATTCICLGLLSVVASFHYFSSYMAVDRIHPSQRMSLLNGTTGIQIQPTVNPLLPATTTTPDTELSWKQEHHLLSAIGHLFFKKMTPSSILLEDLYFTPSDLQNLELYQDELFSSVFCDNVGRLVVLVPSEPDSAAERASIRETWGSVAQGKVWPWVSLEMDVKLIFVIGSRATQYASTVFNQSDGDISLEVDESSDVPLLNYVSNNTYTDSDVISEAQPEHQSAPPRRFTNETPHRLRNTRDSSPPGGPFNKSWDLILSHIRSEIDVYDDILFLDTLDTYNNLTRKILRGLKWTVENCKSAKFILKADQDIFVNIPMIWAFLQHYGEENSIYGHIYVNGKVQRGGKWDVSTLVLPIDRYPIYASGNAYILSIDAAAKVVAMATRFIYVPVEDAFITGILASVTGVDRISVAGFTQWTDPKPRSCDFVTDKIYTGNQADSYLKRTIWRDLYDKHELCK